MSEENPKPDQPAEPNLKITMTLDIHNIPNIPNGATVAEIVPRIIAYLNREIFDTEQLHKTVVNLMESGVNIGILNKDGARYFICSPVGSQSPHREQERVQSKKQKREDDAERSSNQSEDDGDSGRRSHRSDDEKDGARKRRSPKNGDTGHKHRTLGQNVLNHLINGFSESRSSDIILIVLRSMIKGLPDISV